VVNQLPMQQIQVNNTYWKPSGVIGTDEHYAAVMGLDFVEGSFFSQANLKARDKVMVLSERAAVMLFGSAAEANGKTIAVDNGFRMMGGGMAGGRGAMRYSKCRPGPTIQ
ncbi:MAG TPA: ABC transporter permease, partial [Treponemataceae bacterium]|nr:ABC transporter permease [Treponemataceae bacterium]